MDLDADQEGGGEVRQARTAGERLVAAWTGEVLALKIDTEIAKAKRRGEDRGWKKAHPDTFPHVSADGSKRCPTCGRAAR